MARKKPVVFGKYHQLARRWMAKCLLAILTTVLCIIVSPVFAKAPAINSHVPNLAEKAQDLEQQGKTLYDAGRFTEAVKVLQQAVIIFQDSKDNLKQATALSNLCLAYQQLGLWNEAESAIAQSLKILQTLDNTQEHFAIKAQSLDVQGRLQFFRGQTETALTTWQKAADIYHKIGEIPALVRNRINSAQGWQALGNYREAKKILSEVEQTLKNQPDSLLKAIGLRNLGNVLQVVGDLKEAKEKLEQSLALAKAFASDTAISETLFSLGNTAILQQNHQVAVNYYQQAVNASANPNTRIQAQLNQLSLLIDTKRLSEALALSSQISTAINNLAPSRMTVYAKINFAQSLLKLTVLTDTENSSNTLISSDTSARILASAVQQAESLQDKRAESYAIGTLGKLYEKTQQFADAQNLTQKALLIAQSMNASDIVYQWQWQLGRLLKQQGQVKTAIAYYSEAFKTLQSLRSDLVASNQDVQFSFRESVEPVYRELVELLLQSSQTAPNVSPENLKQARAVIESLQLAELDNFFRSACLNAKQGVDLLVDQKDQTAAVIYPIILSDHLHVILKLPKQELIHHNTAINQQEIEKIIADLRVNLTQRTKTAQVKQQSQEIYNLIVRPLEKDLANSGIKTLVFILDGDLRNVPMAVLYDQQQQKYLFEKFAIALTPGLQLLDPKPLRQVKLNTLTAGVSKKRFIEYRQFPPLPNVEQEIKNIQSEVPESEELLNQKFTEINLQQQLQSLPFSVVHLATHGEFSSDPEKTFILTWDKLLKVKTFDNLLRVSDQKRSDTIELLVLSACETAEGDKRAALGLAGVAMRAGARSTLATLWAVDDEYTAKLMSEFYRELTTGVSKAQALQRAQIKVFTEEKNPFFWAPFVLVGNWL
ncbi:MAG: CHAT domain-containing protein [Aulosira sp. DedQUE10]|nr:CHAT domain-containing protein [Aulosira sp. DedQUE10]